MKNNIIVDLDKDTNKTVGDLLEELNVSEGILEKAIKKIPEWYHIIGASPTHQRFILESKRICKGFTKLYPVSAGLYQVIVDQYNDSKDLVSIPEIQKRFRLPNNKLHQFMKNFKGDLHDYLGSNIFLNQKYYYLQARKVKSFVDKFFKWILGKYASQSAVLLNEETNELDTFYSLEEVQAGNSKKARILGFYKSSTGKTEAICGFYNQTIKYLPTLHRSTVGLESPGFIKYDSSVRPVYFSFDLKDVMNRDFRNYFNLLVFALKHKPVSILYSGDKFRIITGNFEIDMSKFQPQDYESKTKQGLIRRSYGNLQEKEVQEFLNKNQIKDKFWRCFTSPMNKNNRDAIYNNLYKDEMIPQKFLEFLQKNEVEKVDYVKESKNKIIIGSKYYPVTFWVPASFRKLIQRLGVSSGLPLQFFLENLVNQMVQIGQYPSKDAMLEDINNFMGSWNDDIYSYLNNWQKRAGGDDTLEIFSNIDKILKGRKHEQSGDLEDDLNFDDGLGE